jgi:hypothetical protein
MKEMLKSRDELTIYDLSYPCYAAEIPLESQRILHIPGKAEFKGLDNCIGFVLEGYKYGEHIELFDAIPLEYWYKEVYNLSYGTRIAMVRELVNDELADSKFVSDWPCALFISVIELKKFAEDIKLQGFTHLRVMTSTGNYVFGEAVNHEYVEIEL